MNVIIPVISNPSSADVEIRSVKLSTDVNLDGVFDSDDEILEDSVGVIVVANIDGVYDIPPTLIIPSRLSAFASFLHIQLEKPYQLISEKPKNRPWSASLKVIRTFFEGVEGDFHVPLLPEKPLFKKVIAA